LINNFVVQVERDKERKKERKQINQKKKINIDLEKRDR
jgi:hypothetical protein